MNVEKIVKDISEKATKNANEIGVQFPYNDVTGRYEMQPATFWTSGYYPGLLWQAYNVCNDEKLREVAVELEEKLDEIIFDNTIPGHDVGFVWLLTSGQHYKFNKNEESRRRLIQTATLLAGRFNLAGGFIRAWDGADGDENVPSLAIIDCTMNLPLLFLATEITGDPRFSHIAKAHADTALKYFIDDDGAVRHICRINQYTGEFVEAIGGQGYAKDSAWSRGASWAIYGMAMAYRYTKDERYLEASKKVAEFFINNIQDDFVPAWDFRAPDKEVKDTSAGAIAASGMLELSNFVENKEYYVTIAEKMLNALYENYSNFDNDSQSMITRATANHSGDENIEVGLIYGDYYFTEAVCKLYNKKFELPW